MNNLWNDADAGKTHIDNLVYLSNLIGSDLSLVQPGGGNTSVKMEETDPFGMTVRALAVKGSGTDLRTITAAGFTHLYLDRLAVLKDREGMSDEEMMSLMRACMLYADRDPVPSVETPLHSLIPARFVAHTHDIATLSLTDTPSARDHVERLYGDSVAFLEYVRPGFPLAKRVAGMRRGEPRSPGGPGNGATGLVMEKHGLCVWGESAKECYANLVAVICKAEEYVGERAAGKRSFGTPASPVRDITTRRRLAVDVLPVIRGELIRNGYACVLHFDDAPETLEAIGGGRFPEVAARGVMTPEHILRAGVRPLVLALDPEPGAGAQRAAPLHDAVHDAFVSDLNAYAAYAAKHQQPDPIPDCLKTIVIPGLGIAYAGKDRRNALIARDCYDATMQVMANAEAVERFAFLSDADACEMEYWPLERRKIEEGAKSRKDLDGRVAVVIGAASGIGRATALRFAAEGAHILLADLDAAAAGTLAAEINARTPERALALALDVGDSAAVANVVDEAVLHFGGIDILFYTPGVAPVLHPVAEMPDAEVERQMRVHYQGAVAATREAARVMLAQGTGGHLVYNASKAAFATGEGAAAYGASKAALVHYVRNVANELGRHKITANYINADAVDTPLFRGIVRQRAESRGETEEQTLARYAERSVMREALVPPEAVAEVAVWLASDRSAYTTGCVITVGGGAEGFPR
jgi:rhamnulose-1-phosphate aldolase/alcohol dehydrogenase